MTIKDDTDDILEVWGQTLTVVRETITYNNSGKPTPSWSSQGTLTGDIQPASSEVIRQEQGEKIKTTHEIFVTNAANVLGGDRIRIAGWVVGNDEYQVIGVDLFTPSHVSIRATLVKGHGG